MGILVTFNDVEFSYKGEEGLETKKVLQGVNLQVRKGEFLAIIGPNGSGKSTLVKHFNGLLLPSEGRVVVGGYNTRNPDTLQSLRRKVGLLFQNPDNQLVSSIVEEEVAFGPENLALPPLVIRERVATALKAVELAEYRLRPVYALSGGQKQRVAIAGLLAMEPEVLVLDEPTSMLDPAGRKRLFEILVDLKKKGIAIILVTHLMEEAIFADRICIFNEGKVLAEGPPREIFRDPQFLETQNLEVPQISTLANLLRRSGFKVPDSVLTVEEMVDYICVSKPGS